MARGLLELTRGWYISASSFHSIVPFAWRKQLLRACDAAVVASVATFPNEAVSNFGASTMVTFANIQLASASNVAEEVVSECKSMAVFAGDIPGGRRRVYPLQRVDR